MSPARTRRGLAAVWLALGVLAAAIVAIEYTDRRATSETGDADPRRLLTVPLDELGAFEIADRGRLHRFERDAAGTWFYHGAHTAATADHTHVADPALSERIERALAAFGRTRIEREFAVDRAGDAYGVTTPEILILVYRPKHDQPVAQYAVGHVAPDTASRYMTLVGSPTVVTIPNYQIDNLLALIQAAGAEAGPGAGAR